MLRGSGAVGGGNPGAFALQPPGAVQGAKTSPVRAWASSASERGFPPGVREEDFT